MSIAIKTILIPSLIANNVCSEVARFVKSDQPMAFQEHLVDRAEKCFKANKRFAKRLSKKDGLDYLYMFMRHWLAAALHKNIPEIYKQIPDSFANGRQLPER